MSKSIFTYGYFLTAFFVLPSIAFATDASKNQPTKEKTPIELQREQTLQLTHKMMGHINLAQFALDIKLPDEASGYIKKAQAIQTELMTQSPELKINSSFKYGKVTYDGSQTIKERYVPVMDDILLISDYETIFKHSKEMGIKETDAGLVHINVMVDLAAVKTSLDNALQDISKKEYSQAQSALAAIFKSAIIDETEIDDPILAISGNLALAKAFLSERQYDKARFTLEYVQKRLSDAKNTSLSGVDQASVDKLSTDLDNLQAELKKEDPTLTQRISDQFDHWKKAVKGWTS
ncbi:YfdX family protein [Nitrosomonas supralitoralis]|uniref:YfdX protein n=1 Tax=Nitrosomonas supralitoralis TaxID=2116706 RepID=A0A2P7NTA7_9PROT|nr:YfdX family protein [Nitrosomonas supralitoralis]PSJ16707.1 hypothetical protein C7H79_12135 [Nitrosomonas supralitoralis]